MCVDSGGEIIKEYLGALSIGQPGPGNMFVKWLLANQWVTGRVTQVSITPVSGQRTMFAELPAPPRGVAYDPSDQKFLAVAAAHAERPPVLQAFDSKWWAWQAALSECGVTIHFLCPDEIKKKHEEKTE